MDVGSIGMATRLLRALVGAAFTGCAVYASPDGAYAPAPAVAPLSASYDAHFYGYDWPAYVGAAYCDQLRLRRTSLSRRSWLA